MSESWETTIESLLGFAVIIGLFLYFTRGSAEREKQKELQRQLDYADALRRIDEYQRVYGEAVSYFYHDALVDGNGIYIPKKVLSIVVEKKYFSLAELDDINERYRRRCQS